MSVHSLAALAYLVAAVLFILGMKRLSSPESARSGNLIAAVGMLLAVGATVPLMRGIVTDPLPHGQIRNYALIVVGIVVGAFIGVKSARSVKMTAMPQTVAIFNGVGGGAAALVATMDFLNLARGGAAVTTIFALTMPFSALIGSVSFAGSMIAFGKLQGFVEKPVTYPLQQAVNGLILAAIAALWIYLVGFTRSPLPFALLFALSLVLGVLMVLPIGGADMPVVIALLNAFTGLAVAADGYNTNNIAMIIGGTLVGSSGTLLTVLMCRAMNRPITNVLFSAFGKAAGALRSGSADGSGKAVNPITADEASILLAYAQLVIIIPGYGLAVARAQHEVRELSDVLEERGVEVRYAIHPVAGRMPGHMNVLLAEANVPYDKLYDMDAINSDFRRADVTLVVGANDVVNPAANTDPGSPIYGMPILKAADSKQVIVLKRGMSPGFAGIENELFFDDKTRMLFGDARDSVARLVGELRKMR